MLLPRALTHFLGFVLFLGASWAPAQDRAYNAIPLAGTTIATIGNNLGATSIGSDPIGCGGANDVWYSWVAGCNGVVTVDTCGAATNFDTVLAAYDGTCGPNSLILLDCNNQFCSNSSRTTFDATQGITYYIKVAGYAGATGTFALSLSCVPGIPTNNACTGAHLLRIGDRIVGNNFGATTSASGLLCNGSTDVWYVFSAYVSGTVTISTCNADVGGVTNFDTVLNVFQGSCNPPIYVGCNDDACGGLQSKFTFAATALTNYFVSVGGYGGATGMFGLKVWQDTDLAFRFWDQGPGTIGFRVAGPPGYSYYLFATINAGAFPNGWFHGIDISIAEIYYQIGVGPPLTGPVPLCGTIGPFGPLPPGLTIYGVALGTPPAGGYPTAVSAPASYTIL